MMACIFYKRRRRLAVCLGWCPNRLPFQIVLVATQIDCIFFLSLICFHPHVVYGHHPMSSMVITQMLGQDLNDQMFSSSSSSYLFQIHCLICTH